MQYFFDTSAIVKIYHEEEGSEIVLPIYLEDKTIIISELSKVEFLSTIYKKFRGIGKAVSRGFGTIIRVKE